MPLWEMEMSKIDRVWYATHSDFRMTIDGRQCVLACRNGATVPAFLDQMSEAELDARLPKSR
jgi:hypothetical protein